MKDKGPESFIKGKAIYDSTAKLLSKRCLARRSKLISQEPYFSITDAPVYSPYIKTIELIGAKTLLKLRWRNYIVVGCDSSLINYIRILPFVRAVQRTGEKANLLTSPMLGKPERLNTICNYSNDCGKFDYGPSFLQSSLLNIQEVHRMGITGDGVLVGFLDNGFRWRFHEATKNANVIAEYDFINNDSVTSNQAGDADGQDGHGHLCFSTVAGFMQGKLIGVAPNASFILAKTEDDKSEKRIEEDNYAAGIEWFEAMGADISSSSLGYKTYDSTDISDDFLDFDGKTTISARAINRAFSLGMVCISAAGNSGPSPMSIITPADADGAIAVAAIDTSGAAAGFSSRGPANNREVKPNLAALGSRVVAADGRDSLSYVYAGGTSLATPQIAGLAALILSTFPELSPSELRDALQTVSSQATKPDSILGYGVPDIYRTLHYLGIIIGPISYYKVADKLRIISYIKADPKLTQVALNIKFGSGSDFKAYNMKESVIHDQFWTDIPISSFDNKPAQAYISAQHIGDLRRMPNNWNEYVEINPSIEFIHCGIDPNEILRYPDNTDIAYLNPSVINSGINDLTVSISVADESEVEIVILNSIGQFITRYHFDKSQKGLQHFALKFPNWASGAYFIHYAAGVHKGILPFIIVK
ncbi:MAG: S8 family serine peptidase [Candidatus Kapabacteria bacterium]|nr:S8 family serine peptidase [Candidatus Kapabacteria bacterium]